MSSQQAQKVCAPSGIVRRPVSCSPEDGDGDIHPDIEESSTEEHKDSEDEQDARGEGDAAVRRSHVSKEIFLEAWRSAVRYQRGRAWFNRTQPVSPVFITVTSGS